MPGQKDPKGAGEAPGPLTAGGRGRLLRNLAVASVVALAFLAAAPGPPGAAKLSGDPCARAGAP